MPNSLRIEHLSDIIPKTQIWLVVNLPIFMSVYIHFNVPPTRITDLARNVSDEKNLLLIWNSHPCDFFFCFYQLGLCSVTYTVNEYSIYHFCVMIRLFHFLSRVIIVQGFETVIFMY